MQKPNGVLFLTLKIFSATGGIEKVCKVAGKALYEIKGDQLEIYSIYDSPSQVDPRYFPGNIFRGFAGKKLKFISNAVSAGLKKDLIILSHINILTVGYLVKLLRPRKILVLFAHGIEVWNKLPGWKIKMLKKCDKIIAVSEYTKQRLKELYDLDEKCVVINNSLDPYLPATVSDTHLSLYKRYNLTEKNFILLTVTRISKEEKYKGHEKVIEAIGRLINEFPNLRYIIAGKYDSSEKARLDEMLHYYKLADKVIFTGFIPEDELAAHYTMSDLFIMPSTGEGFGIVFIEAMYYGLPVIAGNRDGSVDALSGGELGSLVDPFDTAAIASAIKSSICNHKIPDHAAVINKFGYQTYKSKIADVVNSPVV